MPDFTAATPGKSDSPGSLSFQVDEAGKIFPAYYLNNTTLTDLDERKLREINDLEEYTRQLLHTMQQRTKTREDTMLEQLLRLYTVAMATGVTSPMPHFVGPPGSGKSSVFYQLARLLGVNLHVVNVSRLSPLNLEGLEMPDQKNEKLRLLMSKLWTQAQDGDIYLFDEFLRGFPEVYNGLLDIFTAREVAGFKLPKVFIAGASNSTVSYDKALEDRLLHIKVPDPRKKPSERRKLAIMLVNALGLHPEMATSYEMEQLLDVEVLPTFELLDHFDGKASRNGGASIKGSSIRKLIGQAQLRQIESQNLKELIAANNQKALRPGKTQYMFLLDGKHVPTGYEKAAKAIKGNPKLSRVQALNLEINLQLIELEQAKNKSAEEANNDIDDDELFADESEPF